MMLWAYMNSVRKLPSTISVNAVEYMYSTRPEANPDFTVKKICLQGEWAYPFHRTYTNSAKSCLASGLV